MRTQVERSAPGLVALLALLAATWGAGTSPAASAQEPMCFGLPATIVAVAGQPTVGTDGDDVIVGTPGDDDIRGGLGDDRICGLSGADLIAGGGGDDHLAGDGGRDRVLGGKGSDLILGGAGADELLGKPGHDTIRGNRGDDMIWAGRGLDSVFGGPGADTVFGGPQDDRIFGNGEDDVLAGGRGDDTLLGRAGRDGLSGGQGDDTCRGGRAADELTSCESPFAAPGDSIEHVFREDLGRRMVGRELDVWLVPSADDSPAVHAVAGAAVVRAETVRATITIPETLVVLEPLIEGARPILGVVTELPEGPYAVWVGGSRREFSVGMQRLEGLEVEVTAPGRLRTPDVSDVTVDPNRALLSQTGLGDVALGTPVAPALAALRVLFGTPTSDSGWQDGCWYVRRISWQGLSVSFHGTRDEAGRFVSGWLATFVATDDTVLGPLTTADGVAVGMTVEELMALTPTTGFSAGNNALGVPAALTWWADTDTYGGLGGQLSADATHPDARLIGIGNGDPSPFFDC